MDRAESRSRERGGRSVLSAELPEEARMYRRSERVPVIAVTARRINQERRAHETLQTAAFRYACQDSRTCLKPRHGIHLPSAKLPTGGGRSACPSQEPTRERTRMYRATVSKSRALQRRRDNQDWRSEIRDGSAAV